MPQAVQTGALTPATAAAAMLVLRLWPRVSRDQNRRGASAERFMVTCRAVVPSAVEAGVVCPTAARAFATVSKNAGVGAVLSSSAVPWPMVTLPKLY